MVLCPFLHAREGVRISECQLAVIRGGVFDVFMALHAPRWRMPSDASMIEKYGIATTVATRKQLTLKQLNNALDVL